MQNVSWVYILFTALVAVGVLLQAGVLVGMLIAMKAALNRMEKLAKLAEDQAIPLMQTSRKLLDDVSPKLKTAAQNVMEVSENVKEVSQKLRSEADHVNGAVDDLLKKTEVQAARVDEMITGTLNSIAHATATLQRAVGAPVRQVSAIFSGLRAGFGALRGRDREVHAAADGDHFV